jgi:hypothetical protein
MFNTYIRSPRDKVITHGVKTVIEKRAPTDESVRLLREMEASARAEIEKAVTLEGNEFKAKLLKSMDGPSGEDVVTILYEVAGDRKRCDIRLAWRLAPSEKIDAVKKGLSEHLASTVLIGIGSGLMALFKP